MAWVLAETGLTKAMLQDSSTSINLTTWLYIYNVTRFRPFVCFSLDSPYWIVQIVLRVTHGLILILSSSTNLSNTGIISLDLIADAKAINVVWHEGIVLHNTQKEIWYIFSKISLQA